MTCRVFQHLKNALRRHSVLQGGERREGCEGRAPLRADASKRRPPAASVGAGTLRAFAKAKQHAGAAPVACVQTRSHRGPPILTAAPMLACSAHPPIRHTWLSLKHSRTHLLLPLFQPCRKALVGVPHQVLVAAMSLATVQRGPKRRQSRRRLPGALRAAAWQGVDRHGVVEDAPAAVAHRLSALVALPSCSSFLRTSLSQRGKNGPHYEQRSHGEQLPCGGSASTASYALRENCRRSATREVLRAAAAALHLVNCPRLSTRPRRCLARSCEP